MILAASGCSQILVYRYTSSLGWAKRADGVAVYFYDSCLRVLTCFFTLQTRAGNGAPPRDLARELSSSLHRGGPPGGRAAAAQKQFYLEAAKK